MKMPPGTGTKWIKILRDKASVNESFIKGKWNWCFVSCHIYPMVFVISLTQSFKDEFNAQGNLLSEVLIPNI
jgi:hypothetical protein